MNHPQTLNALTRRRFLARTVREALGTTAAIAVTPALVDRWSAVCLSGDWPRFTSALASALPEFDAGEFLILRSIVRPYYVQFCGDTSLLRVEAVSNLYLREDERLPARSHRALVALGWKAPSREPHRSERDPTGSSNYYMDVRHPVAFGEVAALVTRTLHDVYGVTHPAALTYKAGAPDGTVIKLPTLGIARRPPRAGRSTQRTAEEQELLDSFARDRGREWTEDFSELILVQARELGFL